MEGISLGWNCESAGYGVINGIRNVRQNGYKTGPFDEIVSNYEGVIQCIKDDFEFLCDTKYLELLDGCDVDGLKIIYNNKYKFIFNHESPGHANLYISQNWKKGINHYVMNEYEEFINRFKRRAQNFRDYCNSGKHIQFILTRWNTKLEDVSELNEAIKLKYPTLSYNFVFVDVDKDYLYRHLIIMKISEDSNEIKRLIT